MFAADQVARLWTSVDGTEWVGGAEPAGRFDFLQHMTDDGRSLVALGARCSHPPAGPPCVAAAWGSVDGLSWTKLPDVAGADGAWIYDAVTAGSHVAVGGLDAGCDGQAMVWESGDLRRWSRIPDFDGADAGVMTNVVALDDQLIAVGVSGLGCTDGRGQATGELRVWNWTRGRGWALTPTPEFGCCASFSIASGRAGIVAVGGLDTVVLVSRNGSDWNRAVNDELPVLRDIAADSGGYLAVGQGIWSSVDGSEWTQEVNTGRDKLDHLSVGPRGAIASGWDPREGRNVLWMRLAALE